MHIAVIGGGAAGIMAAISAAENGAEVDIFESNEKLGKKLYITGKGRCNVTNNCAFEDFIANIVTNPQFMYSSVKAFSPAALCEFIQDCGVALKTERGDRVFPQSDKSSDIIKAFTKKIGAYGIKVFFCRKVSSITHSGDTFTVICDSGKYQYDKVIIATGGASYQETGSTGDGYKFAAEFGHTIIPPVAALSGLITAYDVSDMAGLSLRNVGVSALYEGKTVAQQFGEMLFTHNGLSGPVILTLSSYINRMDFCRVIIEIDLKPALDNEKLDNRLLRDFAEMPNKMLSSIMPGLMPVAIISFVLKQAAISGSKKLNQLTKKERIALVCAIKHLSFGISGLESLNRAIITSGGVKVEEINPKTMESKILKGLYLAGEVLDVDAVTGGFNLQIAFSSGRAAGKAAAAN